MQKLHDLGARRVLVTGIGPLGCVPAELAYSLSKNGECVAEPQRATAMFNNELFQMLLGLNKEIGSDTFIAANAFDMNMDIIIKPQEFGLFRLITALFNYVILLIIMKHLTSPNPNEFISTW